MTNIDALIESIVGGYGFTPDPGFSGHLARYSRLGTAAAVVGEDGGRVLFQLYALDGDGADFEMVWCANSDARWGSNYLAHRLGDVMALLELEDRQPGVLRQGAVLDSLY